jgi:betaine-aldehyde dehydrogenase
LEPSDTPLTALALAEVLKEAGLPDGLFNVVLGEKETVGAMACCTCNCFVHSASVSVHLPFLMRIYFYAPNTQGQMLTRHPEISKVSFTGEMGTAKAICKVL